MSDGLVQVPPDSTGKKVDTSELNVGGNVVERQRINASDPSDPLAIAAVTNSTPAATNYGVNVRDCDTYDETAQPLTVSGRAVMGRVNDTPENFLANEIRPISITPEGRVRVSSAPAEIYMDFFGKSVPDQTGMPGLTDNWNDIFG